LELFASSLLSWRTIVGITAERVASPFQFFVQVVEEDVG
jgi:hypothetical protein